MTTLPNTRVYWEGIKEGAEKRDGFTAFLWEGLCGLFVFNTPLIDQAEAKLIVVYPLLLLRSSGRNTVDIRPQPPSQALGCLPWPGPAA